MNIRAPEKYEQTKIHNTAKIRQKSCLYFLNIIYVIKLCRNVCKKAKWKFILANQRTVLLAEKSTN